MSNAVLPQLQTVETELVAQVSQLEAQLTSVQEKLNGIRAVLPMFETAETTDNAAESVATEAVSPEPAVEEIVAEKAPKTKKATTAKAKKATAKKTPASKKAASKKAPAQKKVAASKKAPAEKATAKKDGRTASWQKYTRPGVKNESIPDAVRLILETQPEEDFKIVDVMTALFKEDMPKSQYLKARNRISNVLSGGVRAGDWYKGARGSYRMTAA